MRKKKLLILALAVFLLAGPIYFFSASAWGPVGHNIINSGIISTIPRRLLPIQYGNEFAAGGWMADIAHGIDALYDDANTHSPEFALTLFEVASNDMERDWAAGWVAHQWADTFWSWERLEQGYGIPSYCEECNVPSYEQWAFYHMNDVALFWEKGGLLYDFTCMPGLVVKAMEERNIIDGDSINEVVISEICDYWIVAINASLAASALPTEIVQLRHPCFCPSICWKKTELYQLT